MELFNILIDFSALCEGMPTWRNRVFSFPQGLNSTTILAGSPLMINVTYEPNGMKPRLFTWKHGNLVLNGVDDPRINLSDGEVLAIDRVRPSDAGHYTLTASNGPQCQSAEFTIFIECELKNNKKRRHSND